MHYLSTYILFTVLSILFINCSKHYIYIIYIKICIISRESTHRYCFDIFKRAIPYAHSKQLEQHIRISYIIKAKYVKCLKDWFISRYDAH